MTGALDCSVPPYHPPCGVVTGRRCPCNQICSCDAPEDFYKVHAPAVVDAPHAIWRRFVFSSRQDICAPADHPAGGAICRKATHKCNTCIRAIRARTWHVFSLCEEYDIEPPTYHFAKFASAAYGRASIKRAIQDNALFSCLADVSSLMHARDHQAVLDFMECDPENVEARDFAHAEGPLSHDNWSSSWPVWALYDGLIRAFIAIVLGFADLNCRVPARLSSHDDQVEWPLPATYKFIPLREWLRAHLSWIGADIVRLFQQAAGEAPDVDGDDDASDAGVDFDDEIMYETAESGDDELEDDESEDDDSVMIECSAKEGTV
jgi:hypothetical protein